MSSELHNLFLEWWRNHAIISAAVTAGSFLAAVPQYAKFAEWVIGLFKPKTEQDQDGLLETVINDRFGFSFEYPLRWYRQTSGNNDGHTVRNPEDEKILVRGWGAYDVLEQGFDGWISQSLAQAKILTDSEVEIPGPKGNIEGRRLVWERKGMRSMQIFVQRRFVQTSIECTCPKRVYPQYESLFLRLCHSLNLLPQMDLN